MVHHLHDTCDHCWTKINLSLPGGEHMRSVLTDTISKEDNRLFVMRVLNPKTNSLMLLLLLDK
ncbi:hypothetical protein MHIR_DE00687 [Candidatus Doolittlea endobia]|uniref:Uncharacterized protein n=1 Tax=Candidatus Doolittlea endobia TaxID=1778262 RepID=A0A143WT50_9ENTR|nr:hypothetical protein MHIR_DE00687 [Candidatus Doolittlea endobia]